MPDDPAADSQAGREPDAGFVFAATGERYIALARRAARALRLAMPEAAIDLFSDEPPQDDVFDRVHRTTDDWFRPKMEALVKSRFRRTLYLDADILGDLGRQRRLRGARPVRARRRPQPLHQQRGRSARLL